MAKQKLSTIIVEEQNFQEAKQLLNASGIQNWTPTTKFKFDLNTAILTAIATIVIIALLF